MRKKKYDDLVGVKFNKLLVLKQVKTRSGNVGWLCKCDCGKEYEVRDYDLRIRGLRSCLDCLHRSNVVHGRSKMREWKIWKGMIDRCYTKDNISYNNYGGRGIVVCERWLNSFDDFLSDVGLAPSNNHTIDRFPDVNGNYEPDNTRWATILEQARNRRNNRIIEFNGERKCVSEWASISGISLSGLIGRLNNGIPPEVALTTPSRKKRK